MKKGSKNERRGMERVRSQVKQISKAMTVKVDDGVDGNKDVEKNDANDDDEMN